MTTEVKTETLPAKAPSAFERDMMEYTPQIEAALPAHVPLERFKRVVLTAVNQNPDLALADRRSLFTSCVRAAQDGLMPDGREAALVIFNTKVKTPGQPDRWEKRVQYMPMVAGLRLRMRNSGDVASAEAHVVYEHDHFDYELGDNPHINHKPEIGDRGKAIAAYAIIKLTNGEVLREVMSHADIEAVRAVSKAAKNGPWVNWWGEMARKTVLRRCSKAAPMQSDLDELLKRDDNLQRDEPKDITPETARPVREDYVWKGEIVDRDGQVDEYEDEAEYLTIFAQQMSDVAEEDGREALAEFWDTNSAGLSTVAATGYEQQVQDLRDLYTVLDEQPNGGGADDQPAGGPPSAEKTAPAPETDAPDAPAVVTIPTRQGAPDWTAYAKRVKALLEDKPPAWCAEWEALNKDNLLEHMEQAGFDLDDWIGLRVKAEVI